MSDLVGTPQRPVFSCSGSFDLITDTFIFKSYIWDTFSLVNVHVSHKIGSVALMPEITQRQTGMIYLLARVLQRNGTLASPHPTPILSYTEDFS